MEFCKCGSMKEFGVCSNRHCPINNREATTWIIDGTEYRFKDPVTFEDAVKLKQEGSKLILKNPPPVKENQNKIWVNSPTW